MTMKEVMRIEGLNDSRFTAYQDKFYDGSPIYYIQMEGPNTFMSWDTQDPEEIFKRARMFVNIYL